MDSIHQNGIAYSKVEHWISGVPCRASSMSIWSRKRALTICCMNSCMNSCIDSCIDGCIVRRWNSAVAQGCSTELKRCVCVSPILIKVSKRYPIPHRTTEHCSAMHLIICRRYIHVYKVCDHGIQISLKRYGRPGRERHEITSSFSVEVRALLLVYSGRNQKSDGPPQIAQLKRNFGDVLDLAVRGHVALRVRESGHQGELQDLALLALQSSADAGTGTD